MTKKTDLKTIEEACYEIIELLKVGYCQRYQVIDEVEIILEALKSLKDTPEE